MPDIEIHVNSGAAISAVMRFGRTLENRQRLLVELGLAMLVSIRRTFREQGSPADSWAPLAESTRRKNPKLYGAGHKLLVLSGRLLNSIGITTQGANAVLIGTNLVYAAVHWFGSRDRGGAVGPQARLEGRDVAVAERSYFRRQGLRAVKARVVDADGKTRTHTYRQIGPANARQVTVSQHRRFQNIPARPYLVIRPEDPGRLAEVAQNYVKRARAEAGLEGR